MIKSLIKSIRIAPDLWARFEVLAERWGHAPATAAVALIEWACARGGEPPWAAPAPAPKPDKPSPRPSARVEPPVRIPETLQVGPAPRAYGSLLKTKGKK